MNKAGYTLVELIIVITIIAVFTGMSAVGLSIVKNRKVTKYAKMVNEMVSDFYKNATTKEGEWQMTIERLPDNKTFVFTQFHKEDTWKPYYTESLDGTEVYSVQYIEIDDCECQWFDQDGVSIQLSKDGTRKTRILRVSRERAAFIKDSDAVSRIVFKNGNVSEEVNIVLGTPNNYVGEKK